MKKKNRALKITTISILSLIAILFLSFYLYTLDYYRADSSATSLLNDSNSNIEQMGDLTILYPPNIKDKNIGLIFYPGGKVEDISYLPLLKQISDKGITCILVKMPLNLAVFNTKAANNIIPKFENIDSWYLAGHSLGGAMASGYMENNYKRFEGLILLGAYPINDAPIDTLNIYGTQDIALDLSKLEGFENTYEIKGGNHAYFGNYGVQKGDGIPSISREEQQAIAVEKIMEFINK